MHALSQEVEQKLIDVTERVNRLDLKRTEVQELIGTLRSTAVELGVELPGNFTVVIDPATGPKDGKAGLAGSTASVTSSALAAPVAANTSAVLSLKQQFNMDLPTGSDVSLGQDAENIPPELPPGAPTPSSAVPEAALTGARFELLLALAARRMGPTSGTDTAGVPTNRAGLDDTAVPVGGDIVPSAATTEALRLYSPIETFATLESAHQEVMRLRGVVFDLQGQLQQAAVVQEEQRLENKRLREVCLPCDVVSAGSIGVEPACLC